VRGSGQAKKSGHGNSSKTQAEKMKVAGIPGQEEEKKKRSLGKKVLKRQNRTTQEQTNGEREKVRRQKLWRWEGGGRFNSIRRRGKEGGQQNKKGQRGGGNLFVI